MEFYLSVDNVKLKKINNPMHENKHNNQMRMPAVPLMYSSYIHLEKKFNQVFNMFC